jgi:hypothetical protein
LTLFHYEVHNAHLSSPGRYGAKEFKEKSMLWKKEEDVVGDQPTRATMARYTEAVDEFTTSATAFLEHIPLFSKAREAYEEAIQASAELRRVLDTGDETLRTLMSEIEDTVNVHVVKPTPDKKRPEPAKIESIKAEERSPQVVNELP